MLDERTRKISLGALESAACAGVFKRLFILTALNKIVHFGPDLIAVALLKSERERNYNKIGVRINAVTVAEAKFITRERAERAVGQNMLAFHKHIAHLTAVRARVHIRRAACRAGNTVGEFKPGERIFKRKTAKSCKRNAT